MSEVRFEKSGDIIVKHGIWSRPFGHIWQTDGGAWIFSPANTLRMTAFELRSIADKLDELNKVTASDSPTR